MVFVWFPSMSSSFQQRLSYNTLSDLALALIDGTVYEIVQGLLDIQHLTEKNLYNQRQKLHCEHQGQCSAEQKTRRGPVGPVLRSKPTLAPGKQLRNSLKSRTMFKPAS